MLSRRTFLHHLSKASVLASLPWEVQEALKSNLGHKSAIIEKVEILKLTGPYERIPGLHRQYQAQPIHLYDNFRPGPYTDPESTEASTGTITHHYLRIRTRDGLDGLYGYLDPEVIAPLVRQFRSFLMGKNALAIESLWDQLYRRNRHSRAGHYMMALSAVDNALWDLRGKYFDVPVYQLLGGATREEVGVYGSCLGYTVEKGKAGPRAAELKDKGFLHQKWFLPYGPGSGKTGLQHNIHLVEELRNAVGDEVQLMFDAFMGWDLPYAIEWAKAVEPYRPYWIEEAFAPNRLESFKQLSQKTTIPVATGEHFYNRWEVLNFLKAGAIQFVQADPEWCGGISELVKICHLASSFGAKVFPHGHNLPAAYHVVASQSPEVCPLVEYLINHVGNKLHFQKSPLLTETGRLPLLELPGMGIELDRNKIEKEEIL